MVTGCADVDLRRAQRGVPEQRLDDADAFTAPHQLHRQCMPEGVRRCSTRERYAGPCEPSPDQMVERRRSERPNRAIVFLNP